ncbi:hypothetical protein [Propionibacterium acidifaciens]|uniref:hypothetical protein n=1 Tax=Propionibacterium acidifaciens TaxID=556499 RepID=UPI0023F3A520|nr:hypothetical protein [Propionibacterium acidifaciens]
MAWFIEAVNEPQYSCGGGPHLLGVGDVERVEVNAVERRQLVLPLGMSHGGDDRSSSLGEDPARGLADT